MQPGRAPGMATVRLAAGAAEVGRSGRFALAGTTASRVLAAGTILSSSPGANRRTLKNAAMSSAMTMTAFPTGVSFMGFSP